MEDGNSSLGRDMSDLIIRRGCLSVSNEDMRVDDTTRWWSAHSEEWQIERQGECKDNLESFIG